MKISGYRPALNSISPESILEESIYAQLGYYDAKDAQKVSEWIRHDADIEKTIDKLECYYNEALSEGKLNINYPLQNYTLAASNYLFALAPVIKASALAE